MKLLTELYKTGVAVACVFLSSASSLLFADPAATTAAAFTANQSGTGGFIVNTGTSNGTLGASGTGAASTPTWNGSPISAVSLETNGTSNSSQRILNLIGSGTSVYVTDLGGGTIQISTDPPPTLLTGLIAYWTLDETSGTRYDSSENGNNLSDSGGTGYGEGVIGNAALFDGTNDLVCTLGTPISGLTGCTISAWVQPTGYSGSGIMWAFDLPNTSGHHVLGAYLVSGPNWNGAATDSTGGADYFYGETDSEVENGAWYHIVVRFNGGLPDVWVNGIQQPAFGTQLGMTVDEITGVLLGGSTVPAFVGLIDEVGIWGRDLTGTEIRSLYNDGAGLPFSSFGTTR
jgi:hypothetical protein